jgi:hypothetical protein
MDLVVYTQTYRCKSADRQLEIDECLRRNLNHAGISRVVLFKESDAPPLPQATVELEVVDSDERITYAEWFRWVKRQGSGIGLLLNADIGLDEGLEDLADKFDSPNTFLALTRTNPDHNGLHLNDCPNWKQEVVGINESTKRSQEIDDVRADRWDNQTAPGGYLWRNEACNSCSTRKAHTKENRNAILPKLEQNISPKHSNNRMQIVVKRSPQVGHREKQHARYKSKEPANAMPDDQISQDFQSCSQEAMAQ